MLVTTGSIGLSTVELVVGGELVTIGLVGSSVEPEVGVPTTTDPGRFSRIVSKRSACYNRFGRDISGASNQVEHLSQ